MTNADLIAAFMQAGFTSHRAEHGKVRLVDPRRRVADVIVPDNDNKAADGAIRMLRNWVTG